MRSRHRTTVACLTFPPGMARSHLPSVCTSPFYLRCCMPSLPAAACICRHAQSMHIPRFRDLELHAGLGWRSVALPAAIPGAKAGSIQFPNAFRPDPPVQPIPLPTGPARRPQTIYHRQQAGRLQPQSPRTPGSRIGRLIWQSSATPINRADRTIGRWSS
jgi:hypothetical protein